MTVTMQAAAPNVLSEHVETWSEIRCPACRMLFQRTTGIIDPPKGFAGVKIVMECVCKDRRCRRTFRVRIGMV